MTGLFSLRVARTASNFLAVALLASCGGGGGGGNGGDVVNSEPSVPGGVSAVAISGNRIDVTWSASSDLDGIGGYKVLRSGAEVATVTSGTQYKDMGLEALKLYEYSVRACDTKGLCSGESSTVSATTLASMPNVDLATTLATPEVQVGLGTASAGGSGVAYAGPALTFGPVTLGGLSGSVAVAATGPLAGFISIKINGQPIVAGTLVSSGDVLNATVDLAAYAADLQARTGSALSFDTRYEPQVGLGSVTLTLGSTPYGPGILTCSNPAVPPVAANTPCS